MLRALLSARFLTSVFLALAIIVGTHVPSEEARIISYEKLRVLHEAVREQVTNGALNSRQGISLATKLEGCKTSLLQGLYPAAIHHLEAFKKQASAYEGAAGLSKALLDFLVEKADKAQASIRDYVVMQGGVIKPFLCGSASPQILAAGVLAPSPGAVLSHGTIHYVEGNYLDVVLTLPNCTAISSIRHGGLKIGAGPGGGVDYGPTVDYTVVNDVSQTNDRHRVTIRLHFSHLARGISFPVWITAKSFRGDGMAEFYFIFIRR
jgi:hypothetical protein